MAQIQLQLFDVIDTHEVDAPFEGRRQLLKKSEDGVVTLVHSWKVQLATRHACPPPIVILISEVLNISIVNYLN